LQDNIAYKSGILNIILMEIERARELLEEMAGVYATQRMLGLQKWVRDYSGDNGDRHYVKRALGIIIGMNQEKPASRILALDNLAREEILFCTGLGSEIGEQMAKIRRREHASDAQS